MNKPACLGLSGDVLQSKGRLITSKGEYEGVHQVRGRDMGWEGAWQCSKAERGVDHLGGSSENNTHKRGLKRMALKGNRSLGGQWWTTCGYRPDLAWKPPVAHSMARAVFYNIVIQGLHRKCGDVIVKIKFPAILKHLRTWPCWAHRATVSRCGVGLVLHTGTYPLIYHGPHSSPLLSPVLLHYMATLAHSYGHLRLQALSWAKWDKSLQIPTGPIYTWKRR